MKTSDIKDSNKVSIMKDSSENAISSSEKKSEHASTEAPIEASNTIQDCTSFKEDACCGEDEQNACSCKSTADTNSFMCDNEKASLEAENKRLAEEMLRMRAEMENSKKRLQRLFEEKSQEKNKLLLLDIITLLDNFERAMSAGETSKQSEKTSDSTHAVVQGIKMMEEEFLQTLSNKWGLTRYNSVNLAFDPSLHEAMMKEYSDKVSCETVTEEFMKGYMFYEKVIRPAKVKVAVPKMSE